MYVGLNTNLITLPFFMFYFILYQLWYVMCLFFFNFKFNYFIREVKRIHDKVVNGVRCGIKFFFLNKVKYKK